MPLTEHQKSEGVRLFGPDFLRMLEEVAGAGSLLESAGVQFKGLPEQEGSVARKLLSAKFQGLVPGVDAGLVDAWVGNLPERIVSQFWSGGG